eukprot:1159512-Pelagomonas_calceolata.AAC.4
MSRCSSSVALDCTEHEAPAQCQSRIACAPHSCHGNMLEQHALLGMLHNGMRRSSCFLCADFPD